MKLIILAAGDAFELDGYSKLLINHPKEKKNILELYSEVFDVKDIVIVVGFKAIEIIRRELPGCSISVAAPLISINPLKADGFLLDPNGIKTMGFRL